MRRVTAPYDDDRELTSYVWNHYRYLVAPMESLAEHALRADLTARHAGGSSTRLIQTRWGSTSLPPEAAAALAEGVDALRDRVRERILRECRDQVVLNRCPKCTRLVATPQARQCLWCGHDWHGAMEGDR